MKKFLSAPFIVFLLAGTLIPMGVIAYYGLTDRTGVFTLENIMAIGTGDHAKALGLSLLLSLAATVICLILAFPLGLILKDSKLGKKGFMVFIFILPPSMSELRKRLTGRGTETAEAIELRLSKTLSEIEYVDKYDYLVVNGELDEAVNRVKAIIIAEHSKVTMTPEELVREYTEGEEE